MNWPQGNTDRLAVGRILGRWFVVYLAVGLLYLGWASTVAHADIWVGNGDDRLWTTVENWDSGQEPTSRSIVFVNDRNGPVIEDGIDAEVSRLISDVGRSEMMMTGGSLTVSGKGILWAEFVGSRPTFVMSGGEVNLTGSPGTLQMGWQTSRDRPRSARGTWEMTGGEVNVNGITMGRQGGMGTLDLFGGTVNVNTSGGLEMYEHSEIDIREDGTLSLEGDERDSVQSYITEGWITAYGGDGELEVLLDRGRTVITAVNPAMPGDYNANGELDAGDLDLQADAIVRGEHPAEFDLTGDSLVNFDDRLVWVNELKNTWIGDSNLDGEFGSSDLVNVFAGGRYEQTILPAGWAEGDWDGNKSFQTGDLVVAFAQGGYEQGVRPAVPAVPEPSNVLLIGIGLLGLALRARGGSTSQ